MTPERLAAIREWAKGWPLVCELLEEIDRLILESKTEGVTVDILTGERDAARKTVAELKRIYDELSEERDRLLKFAVLVGSQPMPDERETL